MVTKKGDLMERRSLGLGFCGIAAFLFAARYIGAAIYFSGFSQGGALFSSLLPEFGISLLALSIISLIMGIVYLILGERK